MKKVNKTQARKAYNEGKIVQLLPCKVRFGTKWIDLYTIHNTDSIASHHTFDERITYYEYYNCVNELGNYCAYYIEEVQ
jgi:hypothetical protein